MHPHEVGVDVVHHDHALPESWGDDEGYGFGVFVCEPYGSGCDGGGFSGLAWVDDGDSFGGILEKFGLDLVGLNCKAFRANEAGSSRSSFESFGGGEVFPSGPVRMAS